MFIGRKEAYAARSFLALIVCLAVLASPLPSVGAPPLHLTAPRTYATGLTPLQVIPLDLDGDGDPDVAVRTMEYPLGPRLRLFETLADGSLQLRTSLTLTADDELVPADLNQDGRVDLLHVHPTGSAASELRVLLASGAFAFTSRVQSLPFSSRQLCVGNLDRVRGPDLVLADELVGNLVHVCLDAGNGSFTSAGTCFTEAFSRDTDGDGDLDEQSEFHLTDVQCADVDNDGDDDVVCTNYMRRRIMQGGREVLTAYVNSVVRLMNEGAGSLGTFGLLLDTFGGELAVGDMDGDHDLDIVTSGTGTAGTDRVDVYVIRNAGGGAFMPAQAHPSGSGSWQAAGSRLVDVEPDGDLDVGIMLYGPISGNPNDDLTDHWALLRNNGSGGLSAPQVFPAGADIVDLAFANLDLQGGPEALAVSGDDGRLSAHYNEGGTYPLPRTISIDDPRHPTYGNAPIDIAAGDFNADGHPDLVVVTDLMSAGADTLAFIFGAAGGLSNAATHVDFTRQAPYRIHAGQIAGSAATDIAFGFMAQPTGTGLSLGVAGGLPAPMQFVALSGGAQGLTAVDVDGDGIRDLAVLRFRTEGVTAGISVLAGSADGTLTYLGDFILGSDDVLQADYRFPSAIASADVNGDGHEDIIAVTANALYNSGIISVILNYGNLTFDLWEYPAVAHTISDILGADVTGDGRVDLVLTSVPSIMDTAFTGSLEVYPNLGSMNFGVATSHTVGASPMRVIAAQIDGDPGLDLAVANDGSNDITILLNDGHGGFPRQEGYLSGGGADTLALADFDGDGDVDIAVANDQDTATGGSGHFGTVSILANRRVSNTFVPSDYDRDGDVDLADFQAFQTCFNGPNRPPAAAGCGGVGLDGDNDVDLADFQVFQTCFNGPNRPPACD